MLLDSLGGNVDYLYLKFYEDDEVTSGTKAVAKAYAETFMKSEKLS